MADTETLALRGTAETLHAALRVTEATAPAGCFPASLACPGGRYGPGPRPRAPNSNFEFWSVVCYSSLPGLGVHRMFWLAKWLW